MAIGSTPGACAMSAVQIAKCVTEDWARAAAEAEAEAEVALCYKKCRKAR